MKIKRLLVLAFMLGYIGFAAKDNWICCSALETGEVETRQIEVQVEAAQLDAQAEMTASYEGATLVADNLKASHLTDGDTATYSKASKEATITVSREDGIGFLYIKFDRIPEKWSLIDTVTGQVKECGQYGFLHEYVEVEGLPQSLTLSFPEGTVIADVYVFSKGQVPQWVQVWQPPCEKADLLLISSHSDDEQLFFAGVLPYYAGELGYQVQVAYVVQHFQVGKSLNHVRPHEQLDGLWTVGVRNYPVMSQLPDLYAQSKDRQEAFEQAVTVFGKSGYAYEDFVEYITECFRRFKPLVVVSHDLDGEYGHGTHVLCASAVTEAIEGAKDETFCPESAQEWGCHSVEKVYLHLYGENQIVMNYDEPLEAFGGKTAFEVTQDGFACHKSQHWTWFYKWIYGTEEKPIVKATDIKKYSPCKYGLYYTGVGVDQVGGDFFENVPTYAARAEYLAEMRAKMQQSAYDQLKKAIRAVEEQTRG